MTTTHQMGKTTHQMGKTSPLYSPHLLLLVLPLLCTGLAPTPLPRGIGLYSKLKTVDVQKEIRDLALGALRERRAQGDQRQLLEFEFPPLLGGQKSKSQLDDFTNVDVLDRNRDNAMFFAAEMASELQDEGGVWVVWMDETEKRLAVESFPGARFNKAAHLTQEEAARRISGEADEAFFSPAWFMEGIKQQLGGGATEKAEEEEVVVVVEEEEETAAGKDRPALVIVCQPGDGGPIEDWFNVEKLQIPADDGECPTSLLILNGQLDKLRDGYYSPFIFRKLAEVTDRFYRRFEPIFYLKPLLDKGFAGWLYRVAPGPWQVILHQQADGEEGTVVCTCDERPSYNEAVAMMKKAGYERGY